MSHMKADPPRYRSSCTASTAAFSSRLIVGTGKYKDGAETRDAIEVSGAEMVTVAVRRVNLDRSKESLLDFIDPKRFFLLPNTAGCYTAEEAIRAARLGREVGLSDWVKIEVIGDQKTLYPDVIGTLTATEVLVKEGFTVLPYTSDDIVVAKRLIDAGAAAVMPLGAPIGSGLGLQNIANLRILREMITEVPLIVDAGVGTASDAAVALEMGFDAVLMNTAIAAADDPILMAHAMKNAVAAGRQAFLAGRMPRRLFTPPPARRSTASPSREPEASPQKRRKYAHPQPSAIGYSHARLRYRLRHGVHRLRRGGDRS